MCTAVNVHVQSKTFSARAGLMQVEYALRLTLAQLRLPDNVRGHQLQLHLQQGRTLSAGKDLGVNLCGAGGYGS